MEGAEAERHPAIVMLGQLNRGYCDLYGAFLPLLSATSHILSVSVFSHFASPSVEDSSPGLEDFLRTVFGHVAGSTGNFTVAICKTQNRTPVM